MSSGNKLMFVMVNCFLCGRTEFLTIIWMFFQLQRLRAEINENSYLPSAENSIVRSVRESALGWPSSGCAVDVYGLWNVGKLLSDCTAQQPRVVLGLFLSVNIQVSCRPAIYSGRVIQPFSSRLINWMSLSRLLCCRINSCHSSWYFPSTTLRNLNVNVKLITKQRLLIG